LPAPAKEVKPLVELRILVRKEEKKDRAPEEGRPAPLFVQRKKGGCASEQDYRPSRKKGRDGGEGGGLSITRPQKKKRNLVEQACRGKRRK